MDYPVVLLGAGGHAKVLLDILFEQNTEVLGVLVPNPDEEGKNFYGVPVIGNDEAIKSFDCDEIKLVNGIGSVASTKLRRKVYEKFTSWGYHFLNVIHSSAVVSYNARLARGGVEIMAGAIINAGTYIGENSIINTRASVDHDCQIGCHVHIAPGATLSGSVKIGDSTHIGTGSTIIQGVTIGRENIIGAGSLVLHDIGDKNLVYGSPAIVQKYLGRF